MTSLVKWPETPKREITTFNPNPFNQTYSPSSTADLKFESCQEPEIYRYASTKIHFYEDEIKLVVDKRIQLFFHQLIVCWNVPFLFESIKAQDQVGSGNSSTIKSINSSFKHKTQAAHTSMLPALLARPIDNPNESFVYLKYSSGYWQDNSTSELPEEVNSADNYLDGTKDSSQLKQKSLELINRVAKNKLFPRKALKEFIREYYAQLNNCLANEKIPEAEREVLILYLQRIQEILPLIDRDDFFDNLLNVNLSKGTKKNKLRNIVFKKRYKLIQFAENTESKIAKLILDAQNEIFQKKETTLKRINPLLRYTLLDEVNPIFRRNLEKLLCTSLEQLRANIEKDGESIKRFEEKTKIKEFKKDHQKEIQTLKSKIKNLLDALYEEELIYRSKLFKDLRTGYKDWTQLNFSQLYKRIDPISPMSPSRVSRFEQRSREDTKLIYETPINQRRVDMSLNEARNVARTFGIDPGLFLPSTIASNY